MFFVLVRSVAVARLTVSAAGDEAFWCRLCSAARLVVALAHALLGSMALGCGLQVYSLDGTDCSKRRKEEDGLEFDDSRNCDSLNGKGLAMATL